jgi:hypothetical protein
VAHGLRPCLSAKKRANAPQACGIFIGRLKREDLFVKLSVATRTEEIGLGVTAGASKSLKQKVLRG